MKKIPFTKMAGTGNDFIVVDARRRQCNGVSRRWSAVSQALCDRHHGIGADGMLLLEPSRSAAAKMRIFNADGSEAEMCGNGARCVALYLAHSTPRPDPQSRGGQHTAHSSKAITLETLAGTLSARVQGNRVATRMMEPTELQLQQSLKVGARTIRYGFVNTGVPHMVVAVPNLETIDVEGLGRRLRFHKVFAPQGTNVNFIQRLGPHRLKIRTYERGVEDETLACGTGMVASAIVAVLGRAKASSRPQRFRMTLQPRSGELVAVSCMAQPQRGTWRVADVVMEGPAQRVFDGEVSV
ncbi:MAG: diaminopimelate epimerase [Candidatus Omnitrophica bacterium]|nr:diaminopimelate epimerase [Candidatus Omnitrophota bacterium]